MADIGEDVELFEVLLILGIVGVGGYFAYKGLKSLANYFKPGAPGTGGVGCTVKLGIIPGIIGATQSQVCAGKIAGANLPAGGKVIWSCCSDSVIGGNSFDYRNPDGTVTLARRNWLNYVWPWADVMTYTKMSAADYERSYGAVNNFLACAPASAIGKVGCQKDPDPSCSICCCGVSGGF